MSNYVRQFKGVQDLIQGQRISGTSDFHNFRKREKYEKELRKQRLVRKQFLKDQIINHDRIDLLMTEVLGYDIKDFHMLMFHHRKHKHRRIDKQKWHLALASRGSGKSTIMTVARIILEILKNPNIRILIASKTDTNAVGFLSEIKQKLESKSLVEIFGPQRGSIWNDSEITVASRTSTSKEKTVHTVGVGSALASKHFDIIVADDLLDEENCKTEAQREKIKTWFFKILDPTLEPHGEMSIIGTRYHPEDLYGYLIDRILVRKDGSGKVIREYYIRIPALIRKKNFKPGCKNHEKYISIWPEKFSVKFLLAKRRNQGTAIFSSQYLNDVESMKGKIFKMDWFQWYRIEDINVRELRIFQGVDLAIKQREDADKFAHCTIGVHPKTLNIYVLDYYNQVTHYNDQKKLLKKKFNQYDPIRVGIEANGYQRALIQDMASDAALSEIRSSPIYTETDKTMRAWKLSAYFERGQVYFREGMTELMQHLLRMPDGRYKDLFDALDFAIQTAFKAGKKVRQNEPGLM